MSRNYLIDKESERFIFVIDTDSYSGNFERDTCAYVTGQIGDCGRGDNWARDFAEDVEDGEIPSSLADELEDKILQVAEEGCYRPVRTWTTPGRVNDGNGHHSDGTVGWPAYESIGIFFGEQPSFELIDFMKKRALEFSVIPKEWDSEKYQIKGFRLLREVTSTSVEEIAI